MYMCLSHFIPFERKCGRCMSASFCQVLGRKRDMRR